MNIYQYLKTAENMRKAGNGARPSIRGPRSFSLNKIKRHSNEKLEKAYAAIHRFRIKHPDSKRSRTARHRDLNIHSARMLKSVLVEEPSLPATELFWEHNEMPDRYKYLRPIMNQKICERKLRDVS